MTFLVIILNSHFSYSLESYSLLSNQILQVLSSIPDICYLICSSKVAIMLSILNKRGNQNSQKIIDFSRLINVIKLTCVLLYQMSFGGKVSISWLSTCCTMMVYINTKCLLEMDVPFGWQSLLT
jgi:hypothetical protein